MSRGLVRSGDTGDSALLLGAVALLFAFVPVIGDIVSVPAALLALGLGLRGFLGPDAAQTAATWKSSVGALAGLLALFLVLLTVAAMSTPISA